MPAAAGPEEPITVAHIVVEAASLAADVSHAPDLVGKPAACVRLFRPKVHLSDSCLYLCSPESQSSHEGVEAWCEPPRQGLQEEGVSDARLCQEGTRTYLAASAVACT